MAETYTPTLTGKDGQDITLAATKGSETYSANLWDAAVWTFAADNSPTPTAATPVAYEVAPISFAEWGLNDTTMNGGVITSADIYTETVYTAVGWTVDQWFFSGTELPTVRLTAQPVYVTAPIDYEPWRINELLMNGETMVAADTLGDTHYLANTWTIDKWAFAVDALPGVKVTPSTVYATAPIDYEPWRVNELLMNGDEVLTANTTGSTHYLASLWRELFWVFAADELPQPKVTANTAYSVGKIDQTEWASGPSTKEGAWISFENAKIEKTYVDNTWRFDRYWHIRETLSFPILITEIPQIELGKPLQSVKNFVFIAPSDTGSIPLAGEIYEVIDEPIQADAVVGLEGQVVTHEYGGAKLASPTGRTAVFAASAVEDPYALGGYGSFVLASTQAASAALVGSTREVATERTVQLRTNSGSNVNFYYVEQAMPDYDYLCNMEVPDGTAQIAVSARQVSAVKVKLFDGSIGSLPLVSVDHEYASSIRVMTLDGIFALVQIDKNKNLAEPTP